MKNTLVYRVFRFYYEGFRGMTIGRTLWAIILIKILILFLVFKLIFFPDFLKKNFSTDEERGDYVLEQLSK